MSRREALSSAAKVAISATVAGVVGGIAGYMLGSSIVAPKTVTSTVLSTIERTKTVTETITKTITQTATATTKITTPIRKEVRGTLDVWGYTDEPFPAIFDYAKEEVAKRFPELKVNWNLINSQDMGKYLSPALISGKGVDIWIWWGPAYQCSWVKQGYVECLEDYAKEHGWFDVIYEPFINQCSWDGKLYLAGPWGVDHFKVVLYNQDMFEKHGWDTPTNWDEFISICEKAKNAGYIAVAHPAKIDPTNVHIVSFMWLAFISPEYINDAYYGKGGRHFYDDPFVECVEKLKELVDKEYIPLELFAIEWEEVRALWQTGKVAMWPTGPWEWGLSDSGCQFKWNGFLVKAWKKGVPEETWGLCTGHTWAIYSKSKNKEAAVEFLNYIAYSKDLHWKYTELIGAWNPYKAPLPPNLPEYHYRWHPSYKKALEEGNVFFNPESVVSTETLDWFNTGLSRVWRGELSIDEYLKKFDELVERDRENGLIPGR